MLGDEYRLLEKILAPVIVGQNKFERLFTLAGGGSIEMWSCDSPDAGRGRKYAAIAVDECALIPGLLRLWQENLRPTLSDLRGTSLWLSTPKGINNDFYRLFQRGMEGDEDWASFQGATAENPFIPKDDLVAAKRDMSPLAYAQEYDAKFLAMSGSVFGDVAAAICPVPEHLRTPPPASASWFSTFGPPRYCIGCDWAGSGRGGDYTAFVTVCRSGEISYVVDVVRLRGVSFQQQQGKLWQLWKKYGECGILAEQNSLGQVILENLRRSGISVRGWQMTNATKAKLVDFTSLSIDRGTLKLPDDSPELVAELLSYAAVPLANGMTRFSAPQGEHDDLCVAMMLGLWGVNHFGAMNTPQGLEAARELAANILGGRYTGF
jgi:hypothetical protein